MTPRIVNAYLHIIDGWHRVAINHEELKEYDEAINAYRNIITIYNYINYKDLIEKIRLVVSRVEQEKADYLNSIPRTTVLSNKSTTKISPAELEVELMTTKDLDKFRKRKARQDK